MWLTLAYIDDPKVLGLRLLLLLSVCWLSNEEHDFGYDRMVDKNICGRLQMVCWGFIIDPKVLGLMVCLEVYRGSRGEESRGEWLSSTLFGCF